MRISVKRIYCSNCKKLVSGREETANGNAHILCSKCGSLLWEWNGLRWKHMSGPAS